MKTRQLIDRLRELNPQLVIKSGGRHHKLYLDGRLIGILPLKLMKEGLATNTKCQLKREGVILP